MKFALIKASSFPDTMPFDVTAGEENYEWGLKGKVCQKYHARNY